MQQRQSLLCSVAQVHFLERLIRAEPQKINITCMRQMSSDWHKRVSRLRRALALIHYLVHDSCSLSGIECTNHLKASLRSTSSLSLSWRSSSNFSTITEYDSPTFFFHSSLQPNDRDLTSQHDKPYSKLCTLRTPFKACSQCN